MLNRIVSIITLIMLCGCATIQQQAELQRKERDEQIDDALALAVPGKRICIDQRHAGIFKTYAESAKCSNPQIIAAFKRVKFPYMDLVKEFTDKRLEILQELDNKQIPEERSDKEINEYLDNLIAETHVRDLER